MGRLFWVFVGTRKQASSRIHGYRIHEKLVELGYASYILFEPTKGEDRNVFIGCEEIVLNELRKGDTLVLQKVKSKEYLPFLTLLKKNGVKIGFIDCDLPIPQYYESHLDFVICPSRYLKELYLKQGFFNVHYIPDTPEVFCEPNSSMGSSKLRIVWFGQGLQGVWRGIAQLKRDLSIKNVYFDTVSNHPDADFDWSESSLDLISTYDISLIPIEDLNSQEKKVKSSNRLLQSMALGLVPIVNRIPSYEEIIDHGINGYLVDEKKDWVHSINLLEDKEVIYSMKNEAFKTAKKFNIKYVITTWVDILKPTLGPRDDEKSLNRAISMIYAHIAKTDRRYFKKVTLSSLGFKSYTFKGLLVVNSLLKRKMDGIRLLF